jgi:hypothetical protein
MRDTGKNWRNPRQLALPRLQYPAPLLLHRPLNPLLFQRPLRPPPRLWLQRLHTAAVPLPRQRSSNPPLPPIPSHPPHPCFILSAFVADFRPSNPQKRCVLRVPLPTIFFGASEFQLTQVCRRCRWVPPQGSQIRHDAADASQVNKLAGMSALSSCALCFVPRRSVHESVSDHCSSQRGVRVS